MQYDCILGLSNSDSIISMEYQPDLCGSLLKKLATENCANAGAS